MHATVQNNPPHIAPQQAHLHTHLPPNHQLHHGSIINPMNNVVNPQNLNFANQPQVRPRNPANQQRNYTNRANNQPQVAHYPIYNEQHTHQVQFITGHYPGHHIYAYPNMIVSYFNLLIFINLILKLILISVFFF